MTTPKWAPAPPVVDNDVHDVVAGLLPDGSAPAVARAAVREALARGSRVRFLQVLRPGASDEERLASDEVTFAAALRALRESPRVPVTFEVAEGEVGPMFVERSEDAVILVVGTHGHGSAELAAYCQQHARCDVLTVRGARADARV